MLLLSCAMRKLTFWNQGERQQIEAINEAAWELDTLQSNASAQQLQITTLRRAVHSQQLEIGRLQSALQAVCDLLVDLDLIEEQALAYRIEAAMTAVVETTPPPGPFDAPASAPVVVEEVECARCHRRVPGREISFTDHGQICDSCVGELAAVGIV